MEQPFSDLTNELPLQIGDFALAAVEDCVGKPTGDLIDDGALRGEHLRPHPLLELGEREISRAGKELLGITPGTHDSGRMHADLSLLLLSERIDPRMKKRL